MQRVWRLTLLYLVFDTVLALFLPWRNLALYPQFLSLVVVYLIAEHFPLWTGTSKSIAVTVSGGITAALAVLYGPAVAGLITAVASIAYYEFKSPTLLLSWLYNRAQFFAVGAAAGLGFLAVQHQGFSLTSWWTLPALFVAGIAQVGVNLLSVVTFVAVKDGIPFRRIWRQHVTNMQMGILLYVIVGGIIAAAYVKIGVLGLMLAMLPLIFARIIIQKFFEVRDTYLDTISTLISALEAKDSYTAGHSERVGKMAAQLGEHMKLSAYQVEHLYYTGVLHDIGKIGIPDDILNKPGAFVLDEYMIMQRHATMGAQILKELKFIEKSVDWVLFHHERWDGKGYPTGLMEKETPLEARVIAVVDAWDAMVTDRPYRKGLGGEVAAANLSDAAGRQFDPEVVKAFFDYMQIPIPRDFDAQVALRQVAVTQSRVGEKSANV